MFGSAAFGAPAFAASVSIPQLKAGAADPPLDTASLAAVIVVDTASGKTLYKMNPDKQWPAASLTKLMTARVFTSTPTNWNATGNILNSDEVGGGRLRVPVGTTMSIRDLLYSAIVGSANNAANALARLYNGKGANAFVQSMNEFAAAFGLNRTKFYDASGMNPANTVTAYDVAVLLQETARSEETVKAMMTAQYSFATRSPVERKNIKNTNDLLFIEPEVLVSAGKTGYLEESRYNYAVRVKPSDTSAMNGGELVVVIFGAPSRPDSVHAAVILAKWAWENFEWKSLDAPVKLGGNYLMGDRNEDIRELQKFLNAEGVNIAKRGPGSPGQETAFFGALTRDALKRFQEAHRTDILDPYGHTEASGYLDFATRAFIHEYKPKPEPAASAGILSRPLSPGDISEEVRILQEILSRDPDVYPERLVTGFYGQLTIQAVQRFQMKHSIVTTAGAPGYGYVGPGTRAKLNQLYGGVGSR